MDGRHRRTGNGRRQQNPAYRSARPPSHRGRVVPRAAPPPGAASYRRSHGGARHRTGPVTGTPMRTTIRSRAGRRSRPGHDTASVRGRTSRPVRRVLLPPTVAGAAVATIHLGPPLPAGSRDLPAGSGEQPSGACCAVLLRAGFTQPPQSPAALVGSYPTVSPLPAGHPAGGLFSVALSRGSPRVAVSHRPALWSPDVPRSPGLPGAPRPPGRLVRATHSILFRSRPPSERPSRQRCR